MARTLEQIISEIGSTYDPQVNTLRQRQGMIPSQLQAEEQGLQAKQETAFGDILSGARRRGLGFSGIPLAEQAKYTSTEFLPAMARLRQSGREQALSLEDAINNIYERRNTLAQQIRQQEVDRDWQREQFDRQLAAQNASAASNAKSAFAPTLGSAPTATQAPKAFYSLKNPNNPAAGFNFTDANGRPISAVTYANLTGTPLTQLLQRMAQAGDEGAKRVLPYTRDSGFVGRGVLAGGGIQDLFRALEWQ